MKKIYSILLVLSLFAMGKSSIATPRATNLSSLENQIKMQKKALPAITGSAVAYNCFQLPGTAPKGAGLMSILSGAFFSSWNFSNNTK